MKPVQLFAAHSRDTKHPDYTFEIPICEPGNAYSDPLKPPARARMPLDRA
ncbi:MAG: hypothetical protein ACI8PT_004273, partial [Gammaproteobacteria bacterium]